MELDYVLADLEHIAREAGTLAQQMREGQEDIGKNVNITNSVLAAQKSALSEADFATQKLILEELIKKYSTFGVIAEEERSDINRLLARFAHNQLAPGKLTIIIDPVDGSKNYLNPDSENADFYAVSISLAEGNDILGGVMYFPELESMMRTGKGRGTFINGEPVRIKPITEHRDGDPIRASSSLGDITLPFEHLSSVGCLTYNILSLLNEETSGYLLGGADLLDFACAEVAYTEAGGYVGNRQSQAANISRMISTEKGSPRVEGFLAFTPTRAYHQSMMRKIRENP
jgi:fructose-1,6-bisphosphatase/inositol monophosphatase family enzyme